MFVTAESVPDGSRLRADVCIIGAGAAGITLARELAGGHRDVLVLEAGGLEAASATPALYRGENAGVLYYPLSACRLRYFGGTTNHWGGACWPLEAIDFEKRDGVAHSGWPLTRADLDPYYARAHEICQLAPYDYRVERWADPEERPALPLDPARLETRLYMDSPPTRFGQVYREDLRRAGNVRVVLGANVLEIEPDPELQRVERVHVGRLDGGRFQAEARAVVLATGGLENPRLLLLSNRVAREGLGNRHDLVGRFFQEHPMLAVATLALSRPFDPALYVRHEVEGQWIRAGLGLPEATLRAEGLLNLWCGFLLPGNVPVKPQAQRSWRHLVKSVRRGEVPEDLARHLGVVIRHMDEIFWEEPTQEGEGTGPIRLVAHAEQAPNPASRVTLGPERDELGLRRLRLDWRLGADDRRSLRRSVERMAREIGRAGIGRLRVDLEPDDEVWRDPERASEDGGPRGSFHQMGTTRMHDSPREGVVDGDCRVHGLANLYVAGSSVFTTSGYANPTLTIVALAVRLAEHLEARLAAGAL